jgi:hypothetical protein
VLNTRACVSPLIFERIPSKFPGNMLRLTTSGYSYVLFTLTHRVRASAIFKRSLIFGLIMSKCSGNIHHIPIGYMGHLMCVWIHVLTARPSLPSRIVHIWSPNVAKNLMGKDYSYYKLGNLCLCLSGYTCPRFRARVLTLFTCVRSLIVRGIFSKLGKILHIIRGYMGYLCVNVCANSARQYTFAHRLQMIFNRYVYHVPDGQWLVTFNIY